MKEDFVVAAIYPTELDAEVAKTTLAAAGIEAIITLDDVAGMIGSLQSINGVKVLVDAGQLEEARQLLSEQAEELPPE